MTCIRCCGSLVRDNMWDLPRRIQEFFCMNCGERFWIDTEAPSTEESRSAGLGAN